MANLMAMLVLSAKLTIVGGGFVAPQMGDVSMVALPDDSMLLAQEVPTGEAVETLKIRAQRGQRVDLVEDDELDPAIFTDISPYAQEQDAVRLPDDQALE